MAGSRQKGGRYFPETTPKIKLRYTAVIEEPAAVGQAFNVANPRPVTQEELNKK